MIWYLAFTGMFLLYQLDIAFYACIALIAKLHEAVRPVPGHPLYRTWHRDRLMVPGVCDDAGYRLTADAAGNTAVVDTDASTSKDNNMQSSAGQDTPQAAAPQHAGWQIGTAATSHCRNSSIRSSVSSTAWPSSFSADALNSSIGSSLEPDNSFQPGTPKAADLPANTLNATALQSVLCQASAKPQLATVFSIPQASSPVSSPHITANSLRFRPGGSHDGLNNHGSPKLHTEQQTTSSRAAGFSHQQHHDVEQKQQQDQRQASCVNITVGRPQPPSSVYIGADRVALLPASLVAQYTYFPLVLVQLPMYNEESHCEVVIERACNILWPRNRVVIQVCDDSTRDDVQKRIDQKIAEVAQQGHTCIVTRRAVNKGFKAGNMINGMAHLTGLPWEFVAVFDADFEMPPDFLYQTIWHMQRDSSLGFVQARWSFTNGFDNMLCWAQAVSLNFHFAVEQRARSYMRTFFGFNGTAGVWRRTAMEQAGGWNMESTVEDMDLSLRAYLNGWHFKYLHWVSCPNELPPTMSAYKTQQYRWNSGPMVVIKQLVTRIWTTNKVTFLDRVSCTYFFFRFVYSAFLTSICLLCPAIIIWLDPWEWTWAPMTFLVAGNTSAACFIWFAGLLFWPYFLLQMGVGFFRVYAMMNGLIGSKKSGTWKVTKKFGRGGLSQRVYHKPYLLEFLMAAVFMGYAFAAVWYRVYVLGSFCWVVSWTFMMLCCGDYIL